LSSPRTVIVISIAVIACVISLSFIPLFSNSSYVWDDIPNITENKHLKPVSVQSVSDYWKNPFLKLYVPLTYTAWSVIWQTVSCIVPQDPGYQIHARVLHMTNLLFHILNTILLFLIILRLTGGAFAACLGAILFGIHPVQVESVAYITEFRTLLACFFSFLSIHQYLVDHVKNLPEAGYNLRKSRHYFFSLVFFSLALLSKPVSAVVPLFLLIINHFFFHKDLRSNLIDLLPWIILTVPIIITTKYVQPNTSLEYVPPFRLRPFIVFDTATFYLLKLFYPNLLGIDYARTPEFVLSQWWGYLSWIISFGLLAILWFFRRKYPLYLACFLLFLAGFLPVSGIVPFIFQIFSTVTDRYLYLSMMGPAIAAAVFIQKEKNLIHLTPVFIISALLMMTTFVQTQTWNNGLTLYTHALKVNPMSYWSLNNLANTKTNLLEKIFLYRKAIRIKPNYTKALGNLAIYIFKFKNDNPSFNMDELIDKDRDSVEKEAKHFQAGVASYVTGNFYEALEQFGQALALNMLNPKTYNNLGILFILNHDHENAVWLFRLAITLQPENPEAMNNLAIATYRLGDRQTAIEYFDKALAMKKSAQDISANREKAFKGMSENTQTEKAHPKFEYLLLE
jgi:tetratricopeptide (TPR) repeat protein